MTRPLARAVLLVAAIAALAAGAAFAQSGDENSRFVRFLEGMMSVPGRQVSLSGVAGALSSSPTVAKITVSDAAGPWLEVHNAEAVWTRRALFRGVLDIDTLTAERVTVLRRPAGAESADAEDGSGLPVEIRVDAFRVPAITIAAGVAGGEARLSAEGSAEITSEATAARLALARQDRPGSLRADLRWSPRKTCSRRIFSSPSRKADSSPRRSSFGAGRLFRSPLREPGR
jgi:translocation and assembly module TamB